MAYMNQEKKAKIMNEIKSVLPKGWRATGKVSHHMSLHVTIRLDEVSKVKYNEYLVEMNKVPSYMRGNKDLVKNYVSDMFFYEKIEEIKSAINILNYNNSDVMRDYFDVGYYWSFDII